jgi:hypothetical protein
VAGLCSRLDNAFGSENVFFDERSVSTGGDFLGEIGGAIYTSDAVLVVMGRDWATIPDAKGRLRLSDKNDPVRWKVGLVLAMGRISIPVLVDEARMPAKGDLPRALRDIRREAASRSRPARVSVHLSMT